MIKIIKLKDRKLLIPNDDIILGCQGDNKVETRQFEITDPTLFDFDFSLCIKLSDGTILPPIELTKVSESDRIILSWVVLKEHINSDNKINVQLVATYDDSIWHSEVKTMFVYDGY